MWWSSSALVTTAIVGVQLEQAAVGLVGLDDQPFAVGLQSALVPVRADLAADQVARAAPQGVHEHRRRRGLPVRAGDGDRRLEPRELAEQVGAVQLRARRWCAPGCPAGSRSSRRLRAGGTFPAAWPCSSSRSASGERVDPVTSAPRMRATFASPLIPTPPMPTKWSLRPDQGWSTPVSLGALADESRIERVAQEAFGFAALRPGQREAIEAALDGRDVLVGDVDRCRQVGHLPDRRAADARARRGRVAADRAAARPGRRAARGRGRRRGAAELVVPARPSARRRCTSWPRTRWSSCSWRPSSSRGATCWTSSRWPTSRCSWSTRRTASASGGTTSGPSTCGWARRSRRWAARPCWR